jgi:hypothetical protein
VPEGPWSVSRTDEASGFLLQSPEFVGSIDAFEAVITDRSPFDRTLTYRVVNNVPIESQPGVFYHPVFQVYPVNIDGDLDGRLLVALSVLMNSRRVRMMWIAYEPNGFAG